MYTREQIIDEIKRVAKKIGGKFLKQTDFETHSTIPLSTLKFYLGSWKRALDEAGLKSMLVLESVSTGKPEPKSDDDLLLDLVRLHEDSGEVPTLAMIKTKGKYRDRLYTAKWKSINEAFLMAREKFPKKAKPIQIQKEKLVPETDKNKKEKAKSETAMEQTVSEESALEIERLEKMDSGKSGSVKRNPGEKVNPVEEKIKFIPTTIKPKKTKEKPRVSGEPIRFRGLRFAPASKQGVIYLFGLISSELGFIVESFTTEYPDCEGRRCLDPGQNRWEQVKIQFEYKSSHFKARGHDENLCDILVCWVHDWEKCPLEVLELCSTVKHLDNN